MNRAFSHLAFTVEVIWLQKFCGPMNEEI